MKNPNDPKKKPINPAALGDPKIKAAQPEDQQEVTEYRVVDKRKMPVGTQGRLDKTDQERVARGRTPVGDAAAEAEVYRRTPGVAPKQVASGTIDEAKKQAQRQAQRQQNMLGSAVEITYDEQEKALPMNSEDVIDEVEEEVIPEQDSELEPPYDPSTEPYGAQIMRRIHDDHCRLLADYDSLMGPLDNPKVRKLMERKLQNIEKELCSFEEFWTSDEIYGALPPLADAMDGDPDALNGEPTEAIQEEDLDAAIEDDLPPEDPEEFPDEAYMEAPEGSEGDMDTMDDVAVPADSGAELEETPPEEAFEASQRNPDDFEDSPLDKAIKGWERAKSQLKKKSMSKQTLCSTCGKASCICKSLKGTKTKADYAMGADPEGRRRAYETSPGDDSPAARRPSDTPLHYSERVYEEDEGPFGRERHYAVGQPPNMNNSKNLKDDLGGSWDSQEIGKVSEITDFLSQLGQDGSMFEDEDRMKSYHFHKVLDEMSSKEMQKYDTEPSPPPTVPDKVAPRTGLYPPTRNQKTPTGKPTVARNRGTLNEGGIQTGSSRVTGAGYDPHEFGRDYDDGSDDLLGGKKTYTERPSTAVGGVNTPGPADTGGPSKSHKKSGNPPSSGEGSSGQENFLPEGAQVIEESDYNNEVIELSPGWDVHPHRKMCKDASSFFKKLSQERAFGDPHRQEAQGFYTKLAEMLGGDTKAEDTTDEDINLDMSDDEIGAAEQWQRGKEWQDDVKQNDRRRAGERAAREERRAAREGKSFHSTLDTQDEQLNKLQKTLESLSSVLGKY